MPVALIASMCCACRMAVVILVVKQCIFSHLSPGVYCSAWLLSMSHDFNRPALFFPSTFILDVQFQAITGCFFSSSFFFTFLYSNDPLQVLRVRIQFRPVLLLWKTGLHTVKMF